MKKYLKNILLLPILFLIIFGTWQVCWAQTEPPPLIIDPYPVLGDIELSTNTSLPELIKYIFLFALGIVGFIALLTLMIAAVQYVTSAGNASKATDAKDRIMSALLGIGLLLTSVVLLRIINPDFLELELEEEKIEKINIDSPADNDNGCTFRGYFSNVSVEEGESVTLTIEKDNCPNYEEIDIKLYHDPPNSINDANCYSGRGIRAEQIQDDENLWVANYTFGATPGPNGNTGWCGCSVQPKLKGDFVCNYRKGESEIFYIKGKIKMDGPDIPIERKSVWVKDHE